MKEPTKINLKYMTIGLRIILGSAERVRSSLAALPFSAVVELEGVRLRFLDVEEEMAQ